MNDVRRDAARGLSAESMAGINPGRRGGEPERWLALVWRTAHLGAVVALGAALLGAPVPLGPAAWGVVGSGALLLAQDLRAGRVALAEMAGAVVVLKLLLSAAIAWRPEHATVVFWVLLGVSSLSSHAPKRWRHWSPRRR
ncbi:MAG: hypothetical protein JNL30_04155 [Rubrivivax sp.]|nr:hypothetical protein [Rubrivivax sp.]